jgi:hypothetical protein
MGIEDLLNKVPFFTKEDYENVRYEDPKGDFAIEEWGESPHNPHRVSQAPQASYSEDDKTIISYLGDFKEGDTEENLSKAKTLTHEKLHALWDDPEVWRTMPQWIQDQSIKAMKLWREYEQTGDEDIYKEYYETVNGIPLDWDNPATGGGDVSGEELWTRFVNNQYFPKTESDIGPWGDRVYFDKILKDHWAPSAKKFDELMKSRTESQNGGLINLYRYGGFI